MRGWWDLNVLHYYLIERPTQRHLGPWWRGLRRWSTMLIARGQAWRDAWATRHAPPAKETRMPDVESPTVAPAALGRVLLSRLDPEATAAIIAAVSEEVRKEVHEAAVTEARAQLAQEFSDVRERLLDDLDRQRRALEQDAAAKADQEAAEQLQLDEQDFQDRLDSLRTKARTAMARAQAAEAVVVSLITELCGGLDQRETYLYSGGYGLRSLQKGVINRILGPGGVVLKSKATVSERKVRVTLDDGQQVEHTVFWLAKTTPAGVIDEDADDTDGGI